MKVENVITELQKFPLGTEVCIADWRKHIHNADDEPNGIGLETEFKVELIEGNGVPVPFIALSFINDDYDEDGTHAGKSLEPIYDEDGEGEDESY